MNIREEILKRAKLEGKDAYKPTTMAIRLVEAAVGMRPTR